jgi:hypothetical protein
LRSGFEDWGTVAAAAHRLELIFLPVQRLNYCPTTQPITVPPALAQLPPLPVSDAGFIRSFAVSP